MEENIYDYLSIIYRPAFRLVSQVFVSYRAFFNWIDATKGCDEFENGRYSSQTYEFGHSFEGTGMMEIDEAEVLQELINHDTQQLVGWLYQWTSGRLAIMWQNDPVENVVFGRVLNDLHDTARLNYWEYIDAHTKAHAQSTKTKSDEGEWLPENSCETL